MAGEGSTTEAATYPRGFPRDIDWKWPMVPARNLVTLNYGRALKADTRSPGKVPVFGTNGQCGWHDAPLAKGPGLILGRKGQGPLGVEWCNKDFWVIDTAYYASTLTPDIDLKYLYHLVKYVGLNHLKDGTSNPTLSRDTFGAQLFPLPPLSQQKAIASVLGALDDKIELNRRMNATLEAMARSLFQSWFVDFDPVRAKMDGRKPVGMDEATASLFPDSFQDSELGQIPKGWTVGNVSDVATLDRGAINPGDFPMETFDHFSLPAFDNGRTPKVEFGSAIMSNKFTVTQNSVLLSKLNPHIPRIWLPDLNASRRSVCSTEFMVACSKPGFSREYLFSIFTSSAFASIYGTLVTGTTGSHQRIRPESVLDMKIAIPTTGLIRAFTDVAKPMFDRINRNTEQSRTLATLRDTLLPKLLSGELSVGEPQN